MNDHYLHDGGRAGEKGASDRTPGDPLVGDGLDRAILGELRGRATCSVEQICSLLSIGRSTGYAAVKDGSLPSLRVSNRILIPLPKVWALLGLDESVR
jgi:excisionase family DNA binding protein